MERGGESYLHRMEKGREGSLPLKIMHEKEVRFMLNEKGAKGKAPLEGRGRFLHGSETGKKDIQGSVLILSGGSTQGSFSKRTGREARGGKGKGRMCFDHGAQRKP